MILPAGAIVAVVDGETLRLFRNTGHEPEIDLVPLPEPGLEETSAGSGARHRSTSANPDVSRLKEDDFVASVGAYLNKEVLENRIESLAIIADPRSLGELRRQLHPQTAGKVAGELAKNLGDHAVGDIQAAILAA